MEIKNNGQQPLMYPVRLALHYRALARNRVVVAAGSGYTASIGSRQIVFISDGAIRRGDRVEASVAWPVLLDQRVKLQLVVEGRAAGIDEKQVTLNVERYQFRTRATPAVTFDLVWRKAPASELYQKKPALAARA